MLLNAVIIFFMVPPLAVLTDDDDCDSNGDDDDDFRPHGATVLHHNGSMSADLCGSSGFSECGSIPPLTGLGADCVR